MESQAGLILAFVLVVIIAIYLMAITRRRRHLVKETFADATTSSPAGEGETAPNVPSAAAVDTAKTTVVADTALPVVPDATPVSTSPPVSTTSPSEKDASGNVIDGFSKTPTRENVGELVLGKVYDAVAEAENPNGEEEFHIDAGGSFLNAYKKLQPEQIASMTKDTRELIETQKQLMSTLSSLKPLITDGREMLKTFGDYFGTDMKL